MITLLVILATLAPVLFLVVLGAWLLLRRANRRMALLEKEARQDLLTGLPNRRGLAAYWGAAPADQALILIDLVGFKAVNDSHGHIVGDMLLQLVAARLQEAVPPPGFIARWGGDEFVALVPPDALDSARSRLAALGALPYDLTASGGPDAVHVGARIGLATGEADLAQALSVAAQGLLGAKSG